MRTLALLLTASLAACAVDANLPADDDTTGSDAPADDPVVSYATKLTVSLTAEPPAVTNSAAATFAFKTSKPATTKCRIDGAAFAACTSPVSYAGLASGNHTFDLKATASGKTVSIPTYTWTIDTTAPAVSIYGEPSNPSNLRTPTFDFTAGDAVATTCSLDNAAPTACTSPISYGPLADGVHYFTVAGTDAAGNSSSASYVWTLDATGPAISGLSYTCDPSGYLSVFWNVTDASGVGYGECSYAGHTYDCTGQREWDGYVSGASNAFAVTFYDSLGNHATKSLTIKSSLCQ